MGVQALLWSSYGLIVQLCCCELGADQGLDSLLPELFLRNLAGGNAWQLFILEKAQHGDFESRNAGLKEQL